MSIGDWLQFLAVNAAWLTVLGVFGLIMLRSFYQIGPTEIGLVNKRFSSKGARSDSPIAMNGEAGWQKNLLRAGTQFKLWPLYRVEKHPWVQIPAGQIGLVISQIGDSIPVGAKTAVYKTEFGNFTDIDAFVSCGGQKGVQRPVLPPGTVAPIHPVGFLVLTAEAMFGVPVSDEMPTDNAGLLQSLGICAKDLTVTRIEPMSTKEGGQVDVIGIVTTGEGRALPSSDIAGRIGGFLDIAKLEEEHVDPNIIMESVLASKNNLHDNYQDFQKFLDEGGCIGMQHDPLLYGVYNLNPFLIKVELVRMRVIEQGQVGVVKAYVGLPTKDTSGEGFKFGALVMPGHRGIWDEPLRTGKYPLNPRIYQVEVVPTSILTLNWAEATSKAHDLDGQLSQIEAKSKEGFIFKLDLQVQIHVPDKMAPRVISAVGTMKNLVNEVLQAAVGNHFRDQLQSMEAIKFIETRQVVQHQANDYIREKLNYYNVETPGVYIQDVILPESITTVLKEREVANQSIETFRMKRKAEDERTATERAKGLADRQSALATSEIEIQIKQNEAAAQIAAADGAAAYITKTGVAKAEPIRAEGLARAAAIEAEGLARAAGYQAQVAAMGSNATALVNVMGGLSEIKSRLTPDILVLGGGGGSAAGGLEAVLMDWLRGQRHEAPVVTPVTDSNISARLDAISEATNGVDRTARVKM